MSEVKVDKISPRSGTDVTLGDASDTFTLPASATIQVASSGEIDIASGATLDVNGTIDVTGATVTGLSAGKVLQVITATNSTASSVTSGSWTDTGLTASITCAATTSKVLVWATAPTIGKRNDDWQYSPTLRFEESVTTDVYPTGAQGFGKVTTYMSAHAYRRVGHIQPGLWLHSPSNISELTYTLQMKNTGITTAEYCETSGDSAVIVLMEIGA